MEDVRREQTRPAFIVEFADQVVKQHGVHGVQTLERLVQNDQLGLVDDRGEELHLLLHALAEFLASVLLDG